MRRAWPLVLGLAVVGCDAFAGAENELDGAGGGSPTPTAGPGGSTSATGGHAGTSATGGATSTSSTSTGTSAEDCTNGKDDDGDGKVDCDDPRCGDFACVPAPPDGWSAPGAFYLGVSGASAPACPALDPNGSAKYAGLIFGDLTCSPCSCGPKIGGSCTTAVVTTYDGPGCTGKATPRTPGATNCVNGLFGNPKSVVETTDYVSGACMPMGGMSSDLDPPRWASLGKLCSPPTVGKCSDPAKVCAPKVGGEFQSSVCISHDGDVACPTEYAQKTTLYADFVSTRSCTACACAPPPPDCTASVIYYQGGNGDCGYSVPAGTATSTSVGVCKDLLNLQSAKVGVVSWPSQNTQCTSSGGQATGTVIGTEPTTVCCR